MAVTAKMYGNALLKALSKEIDFLVDTIKVALLVTGYTPDQDAHIYWDDVSASEVSGTGYTAGGDTLVGKGLTYDGPSNTIKLDGTDTTWSASTITAYYAVVYVDTGVPATSALICYIDFGQNEISSNGDFKITWHVDGIATIVAS
ncbi:MAG: hypothetical protein KQ78_01885 [Candidatus Izimaplasma bacterium HR2]|nr:MAG: hypothetical protein KQ78_01885 [Candidatus Izimaplasma bacterium HR2]